MMNLEGEFFDGVMLNDKKRPFEFEFEIWFELEFEIWLEIEIELFVRDFDSDKGVLLFELLYLGLLMNDILPLGEIFIIGEEVFGEPAFKAAAELFAGERK